MLNFIFKEDPLLIGKLVKRLLLFNASPYYINAQSFIRNVTPYYGLNKQLLMLLGTLKALQNLNTSTGVNSLYGQGLSTGINALTSQLGNLTGNLFDNNTELGALANLGISTAISTAGDTLANNAKNLVTATSKTGSLTSGLGDNMKNAGLGLAIDYGTAKLGLLSNEWMGDTKLSKFASGAGQSAASQGLKQLAGLSNINPYGLAMSAVGTGLGAMLGPSKEYLGKHGAVTLWMDTGYDVASSIIGTINPIAGGALALNKGLTNLFGSTSGMTKTDAILGSAFVGAPVKWLNMAGAKTTDKFGRQSWQNTEKTNAFMGNSFGDLADVFEKAREEAGKTYGTFSRGAYNRALANVQKAKTAWDKILAMADQNEYLNIRSLDMTSINNLRYALMIQGGWNPIYRGKMGMKILNNQIDHNRGMRYLSAAALIDNKQMILSAGNGIKIPKLQLGSFTPAISDNTKVEKPVVVLPIRRKLKPGELFFTRHGQTIVVKPTQAVVSLDNRTENQHKESHEKSVLVRKQELMKKAEEKTAKVAEAILEKTTPSYWVELATGKDLGTVGGLAVDLASPYILGKGLSLLGKGTNYLAKGVNKVAQLGASPYTGKWTLFGNRLYRFKPGYLGMNNISVESRGIVPQITAENAVSITPEQWTTAQDAAIARSDMAEAQRLRDLHFKVSAPDTQIKDIQYHGAKGNAKFNVFNPELIGQTDPGWAGRGYYFTPSIDYAKMYGSEPRAFYINAQKVHDGTAATYFGRENSPAASAFKIIRKRHNNDGQQILDELASSDAIRTSFLQTQPYNSSFEEVVTRNNNQMKLADAVTFDDNGVRIPLGERDNFNINDIRYSLESDYKGKPIILSVPKTMRKADSDVAKMNKYHSANVLEYNQSTGNNVTSIPFRTDYHRRLVKVLPNEEFNTVVRSKNTNAPSGSELNVGGMYSKNDDTVYLRNTGNPSNNYHEFLHSSRYGETNPEVTLWRILQLIDEDKVSKMTPQQKAYYISETETPVHLRLQGERMNIEVGDPYPGDEAFDKMLNEYGIGGATYYMKKDTSEAKQLLWKAFNGTLFSGLTAATLYNTNK